MFSATSAGKTGLTPRDVNQSRASPVKSGNMKVSPVKGSPMKGDLIKGDLTNPMKGAQGIPTPKYSNRDTSMGTPFGGNTKRSANKK